MISRLFKIPSMPLDLYGENDLTAHLILSTEKISVFAAGTDASEIFNGTSEVSDMALPFPKCAVRRHVSISSELEV